MAQPSSRSTKSVEAGPSMIVRRAAISIDVSESSPAGCKSISADLFHAEKLNDSPVFWICIPGGGVSREYFDLSVSGAGESYSMARYLARSGDVVLTVDPPGVGGSDIPEDPFLLSPEAVSDVLAVAVASVLTDLKSRLGDGADAPFAPRAIIGLGHSAGALLVAYQQARHHGFDALALLGFSASGLPEILNEQEIRYVGHPQEFVEARVDLTRQRFSEPLPPWSNNSSAAEPDPAARSGEIDAALVSATSRLLALVGMTAIMPGAVQPQLDQIEVPVFLALGERDLAGNFDPIPPQFPNCKDLTLFQLKRSGHSHNIAPTRQELWERLLRWSPSISHSRSTA
jgi:pimeloyl-ACP methyl ester carboxylesterase